MLAVLFSLGERRYGLDSVLVERVIPSLPLRVVTSAPPAVVGVFDYQGQTVSVVDLVRLRTGRPAKAHLSTRIILVKYNDPAGQSRVLGLLAERVNEVRQVAAPTPSSTAKDMEEGVKVVSLPELLPDDLLAQLPAPDAASG